jgi:hypothetical protein
VNSSIIGKIEKAKRYATERNRMRVTTLSVEFHGENSDHTVTLTDSGWKCTCEFFHDHGACAHSMALERVLEGMLPSNADSRLLTAKAS